MDRAETAESSTIAVFRQPTTKSSQLASGVERKS